MLPIAQHPNAAELDLSDRRKRVLGKYLEQEIIEAIAARAPLEEAWREYMRQYDGVPKKEVRETPIINAPNVEVTVGAASSDSIYAQVMDLVFNTNPLVTVRASNEKWEKHARSLQMFVDRMTKDAKINVRSGAEHGLSDCIQLGTGSFYIPFVEKRRKTKTDKAQFRYPMIRPVPIEDFVTPGGAAENLQEARWVGMRVYMTEAQLRAYGKARNWDITQAKPCGPISWVRSRREQLGKTMSNSEKALMRTYEIWEIYVDYDVDGDGFDEDLLVIWDRTSAYPLKVVYNPYDMRPFESCCYQIRPHLFNGIGVLEMTRPYQEGGTEIYNQWITNALIANSRVWAAREGVVAASEDMYPNKVIPLPNPKEDLIPLQMGDVYPSAAQALMTTVQFAERRVGVNDASSGSASMGNRTPGITAISMLQQVNKRFSPAFDAMTGALSRSMMQAVLRYRERILMGDTNVEKYINKLLGPVDADNVLQLFRQDDFEQSVEVELTASSAAVNKEQDRQSLVMLSTQVLGPYYQRIIQLAMLAANPQLPKPLQDILIKVAKATGDGIDQIVRTFDQVRDPQMLAVSIVAELETMQQQNEQQQQVQQLLQMFQQLGQQGVPNGQPNQQGGNTPAMQPSGAPNSLVPGSL